MGTDSGNGGSKGQVVAVEIGKGQKNKEKRKIKRSLKLQEADWTKEMS